MGKTSELFKNKIKVIIKVKRLWTNSENLAFAAAQYVV